LFHILQKLVINSTTELSNYYTQTEVNNLLNTKQDEIGLFNDNTKIQLLNTSNVLKSLSAGSNIVLINDSNGDNFVNISADLSSYYTQTLVNSLLNNKQDSIPTITANGIKFTITTPLHVNGKITIDNDIEMLNDKKIKALDANSNLQDVINLRDGQINERLRLYSGNYGISFYQNQLQGNNEICKFESITKDVYMYNNLNVSNNITM